MERTVSSSFTAWWKFLFPLPFIGTSAFDCYTLLAHPERIDGGRTWGNYLGSLVLYSATAWIVRQHARYRRVAIAPTGLLVSNYFREVLGPFAKVASVAYDWANGHRTPAPITVAFRETTDLGDAAVFFPSGGRDRKIAEGIANEIRERAGLVASITSAPAG